MKDRYLFKAKRLDNGEWVQGVPFEIEGKTVILIKDNENLLRTHYLEENMWTAEIYAIEVDPSTICQCTGLKDKNGKLIWENDIVKDFFSDACAPIRYGSYQNCFDSTKAEHIGFYVDWSGKYTKYYRKDFGYWIHMVDIEVIGNISDNPELLESEE
jgi:uncharacterized phage protein (TIGR01671 family)